MSAVVIINVKPLNNGKYSILVIGPEPMDEIIANTYHDLKLEIQNIQNNMSERKLTTTIEYQ